MKSDMLLLGKNIDKEQKMEPAAKAVESHQEMECT